MTTLLKIVQHASSWGSGIEDTAAKNHGDRVRAENGQGSIQVFLLGGEVLDDELT